MGIYKVVLPKMGESVSEATITKWVKAVGDAVQEEDPIVEIATDKVDSDVPAPVSGTLTKILFEENQAVQVGEVIAWIEVAGDGDVSDNTTGTEDLVPAQDQHPVETEAIMEVEEPEEQQIPGTDLLGQEVSPRSVLPAVGLRFYSPLVKNIAQEEGLRQEELDAIPGSGADGRLTKQDILQYLSVRKAGAEVVRPSAVPAAAAPIEKTVPAAGQQKQVVTKTTAGDEIVEMDRMRRLIADHMVQSVATSPHVSSFVEADVTNLVNWRNKIKASYQKREGENITFTPIFIEAISKALRDFPMVNVSVDGYNIIKRKHINIGMAAALPSGNLIVPVIRDADQLSLVGLSKKVNDLAQRSRQNQLKPDDTQGGTFTFTNIGAFGNIMGVPIINQPQAAILAVGTIKKKPAVLETEHGDVIAIRHMMYLSMSYDHRIIDGALGGTFLKRVADYLENWDLNREI